ncbi:hypothetical protein MEO39_27490, partial [Dolichospermum sp. ST_sed2]|nr:hypothetical protein [Dolichospermum sp. ST_sed2]
PLTPALISGLTASKTSFANYYDFGVGIPFQLTDLANYASFTGLYDNYKINSIRLDLEYMKTDAGVNGNAVMPTVYALQD